MQVYEWGNPLGHLEFYIYYSMILGIMARDEKALLEAVTAMRFNEPNERN